MRAVVTGDEEDDDEPTTEEGSQHVSQDEAEGVFRATLRFGRKGTVGRQDAAWVAV